MINITVTISYYMCHYYIMLVPSIDKSEIILPSLLDKKEIHVESFNNSNSESNSTIYIYMLVMRRSMLEMSISNNEM